MQTEEWVTNALKFVATTDAEFLNAARVDCPDEETRNLLARPPNKPLGLEELKRLSDRYRFRGQSRQAEIIDIVGLNPLANLALATDDDNRRFGTNVCSYVLDLSRKYGFVGCQGRFAYILGKSAYMNQEYERARPLFEESDRCYSQLVEDGEYDYAGALGLTLVDLGGLLADMQEPGEAEQVMSRAVTIFRKPEMIHRGDYANRLAVALNNRGTFLGDQKRYSEAINIFEQAEKVLLGMNDRESKSALAATYTNKARACAEIGNPKAGIGAIKQSVRIKRELAAENPAKYREALSAALINLSMLAGQTGAVADAADASIEAITILAVLVCDWRQHVPHLKVAMQNLSVALTQLGHASEGQALYRRTNDILATIGRLGPFKFRSDLIRFIDGIRTRIDLK